MRSCKPMDKYGRIIDSSLNYDGVIYKDVTNTILTPDNIEIKRNIIKHPDAVNILAKYKGKYVLEYEYRSGINQMSYGLPAGMIEHDESTITAGLRELKEETGLIGDPDKSSELISINSSEGFTNECIRIISTTVIDESTTDWDDTEIIHYKLVNKGTLINMVLDGQIKSAPSVVAILMLSNS